MANTEKISEIIDKQAFDQLARLNEELGRAAAAMDAVIAKSAELSKSGGFKSFAEYKKATEEQNKALKELEKTEKDRLDLLQRKAKVEQGVVNDTIKLKTEQAALRQQEVLLAKATSDQVGAYAQLDAKLKQITKDYKDMAAAGKGNTKEALALKNQMQALDKQIKDIDKTSGQHQRNVGNYTSIWKGFKGVLLGVGAALGVTAGAAKVFQSVINSTDDMSDKFKATMSEVGNALKYVSKSIATMDFSNFFTNIREAAKAGREYYNALDQIEDRLRAVKIREQESRSEILAQMKILRDATKTNDERVKAAEKVLSIEDRNARALAKVKKDAFDTELKNAGILNKQNEKDIYDLLKYYDVYEPLIEQANRYNDAVDKLAELRKRANEQAATRTQTFTVVQDTKEMKELEKQIKETGLGYVGFAEKYKAFGRVSKEERDAIAKASIEFFQAEQQADENTKRSLTRMTNLLAETAREKDNENEKTEKAIDLRKGEISVMRQYADDVIFNLQYRLEQAAATGEEYNLTLEDMGALLRQAGVDGRTATFVLEAMAKAQDQYTERLHKAGLERMTDEQMVNEFKKLMLKDYDEMDKERVEDELDREKKLADAKKQIIEEVFNFASAISDRMFDDKLARYDEEMERLEEQKEYELAAAGDSAEQKAFITRKYQSEQERIEKKRKKTEYDKALFDRTLSIAKIIYETAKAMMEVIAAFPITFGEPFKSIIAAMGALQVATVLAAPLPRYAEGRRGGKGEFAVVGEQGRELVDIPGRGRFLTPDTSTVTYLPAGASVIPHRILAGELERGVLSARGYDIEKMVADAFERNTNRLISTIKGKKEAHIKITREGLWMQAGDGVSWQTYINQNVKH